MKNVRLTFLTTLLLAAFSLTSNAQLKVLADGKVGIATATPDRALEVVGGVMVTNGVGVNTNKQSNFLMRTYLNDGTYFAYFNAQASLTNNQVLFGGGAGSQYAATVIGFLTSPNTTTLSGTERMRIASDGKIRMNTAGNAGGLTHELNLITGDASKPGGGSWTTPSDARIKTNVRPYTDGLEQVLQIKPVYFQYKAGTGYEPNKDYVGIIAQEMQRVAPYTIEEVKVNIEEDDNTTNLPETLLTYNSTAVTYMLINAIKEQQSILDAKDAQIEDLEARLQKIEERLFGTAPNTPPAVPSIGQTTNILLEGIDGAALKQNMPNPFSEDTSIEYSLPRTFSSAYIQISNMQGAVLRRVDLPKAEGKGLLNIKAKELAPGEYVYSLVIDGRMTDTKKMILVNN